MPERERLASAKARQRGLACALAPELLEQLARLRALGLEEARDRRGETRVRQVVEAPGRPRVEAAQELVIAARAGLEARDARLDAVLDRRVVADVEVEVAYGLEPAPVAPVERVA